MISVGQTVVLRLNEAQAAILTAKRDAAESGNDYKAGDDVPVIISRIWGNPHSPATAFNGQCIVDGPYTWWASSISMGDGLGYCRHVGTPASPLPEA